jgi:hypothetical protein
MGDVILFAPQRRRSSIRRDAGESAGAQIMFFTGVRYQRMADPVATETHGGRPNSDGGKRKRKRC